MAPCRGPGSLHPHPKKRQSFFPLAENIAPVYMQIPGEELCWTNESFMALSEVLHHGNVGLERTPELSGFSPVPCCGGGVWRGHITTAYMGVRACAVRCFSKAHGLIGGLMGGMPTRMWKGVTD